MAKNICAIKSFFKISILFLCLIAFTSEQIDWIPYNFNEEYAEKKITSAQKESVYALDLTSQTSDSKRLNYYMKVTVTPLEDNPTPIVIFSPTNSNNDRQVIARATDGPAKLYLKKEQFIDDQDDLYLKIICKNDGCGYTIRFDGAQSVEIDTNTTYSYLYTNKNREMRFEVYGQSSENTYLTIAIEGSSTAQIVVDDVDKKPYEFGNGRILTFPLKNKEDENESILATFYIKSGTNGDYITLNVHTVINNIAPDNLLYPNGPVVTGILEKKEDSNLVEECFPVSAMTSGKFKTINKYYLTGKIHSKYALFWLGDENHQYMEETEIEIEDGFLSTLIETNGKMRYVCFEFSYNPDVINLDTVAYSLSILEPVTLEEFHNFYPPQLMNEIYRRMIPKGSYAVYHIGNLNSNDKRLSFNIYQRKGFAEMYYGVCDSYPVCLYSKDDLKTLKKPKSLNKMTIWEINNDKELNALDSNKNVMVVYCKDDDNEDKGFCELESSIFNNKGQITLVKDEKFSKYVLKGDKGRFKIDLKRAKKVRSLTIDIMIYSGDVSFDVKNPVFSNNDILKQEIEFNHYKYYLSNKIFYHYNLALNTIDYIDIEYTAELNSFFSIQYGTSALLEQTNEKVRSGESYLVQMDPTSNNKTKTIYLENYRYKKEKAFLVNFFALNCDFQVNRGGEEMFFSDGYAQEILLSNSKGYKSDKYEYQIQITEPDLSNYNHKMCMLFVAGYESRDQDYQTEIVVGENINQQVIFNKDFKNVRFLYPQADPGKDLAIYINVIDQAKYNVNLYVNNDEDRPLREFIVTRSQIFYIASTDLSNYCDKDTLCNIIADAQFSEELGSVEKPDFMIEITIRQIKNTPTYLQKSQAKKDFTCGDYFYYFYMDIGKNDVGEISVNFLRDFGNLWGKIVRKDQSQIDEEANWRGKYRMPSEDWEDDLVNQYTKKLEIKNEDTQDCIEGCYLLLSIQISQIGEYAPDSKFYPFSIITSISQNNRAYTDIPKIIIQANEYIVGNIEISENERISQFYEIYLPHNSLSVEFDFQSEVAGLYINVGGIRPTTKNADFKLIPHGRDTLFSLTGREIYDKAVAKKITIPFKDSIQDINLVIGVWTDKTDSVNSELFSLRVFQPNYKDDLDIIEVNTDQKILCNPTFINDNQYRCLFMVTYDDEDERTGLPLIIHAASVNQSAVTNIFGSLLERSYYDQFDVKNLKKNIPTSQSAQYSTLDSNTNYIYIKLSPGRDKYYFYVNVISDKNEEIMIITTMPVYNIISNDKYEFYPNPSTEQLLSVSVEKLVLSFPSSSIIANLVTLDGEANIAWENEPNTVYNLKGYGDRLSLTSGSKTNKIIITRKKEEYEEGPGFVFYISYYERNEEYNFDQVQFGNPVEIAYRNTSLPVYLYSKIGDIANDISLSVTFKDSDIDVEGEYLYAPLVVIATLAKQNTIYKAKQNPELGPSLGKLIIGSYDPALKTAQAFLDSRIISTFNIKPDDNPTLYLSIEAEEDIPSTKYKKFNIEALFSPINSGIVPVERIFNYGRYGDSSRYNYYKLKVNLQKKYMILEIAFNSRHLDFSINERTSLSNNTALISDSKKERGKVIVTIKNPDKTQFLYLCIFKKQGSNEKAINLFNYVFKYENVDDEKEYTNNKILGNNNNLKYEESKKDEDNISIKCTFNRIDIDSDKANITYFFKVVDNESLIYGESCETIAVMESPYYTVYKRNPSSDTNGQITLTANGKLSNWAYLQVIAQIQRDTVIDYVAYKGIENIRPSKDKGTKKESTSSTAFVIIIIILIALVVGLAVIVFIIQQKNKSLVNQVKHISFQQNQNNAGTADPDLLLKK